MHNCAIAFGYAVAVVFSNTSTRSEKLWPSKACPGQLSHRTRCRAAEVRPRGLATAAAKKWRSRVHQYDVTPCALTHRKCVPFYQPTPSCNRTVVAMRTPAHTISNTVADTVYQSRGAQYAITLYASADTSMLPLAARKASLHSRQEGKRQCSQNELLPTPTPVVRS